MPGRPRCRWLGRDGRDSCTGVIDPLHRVSSPGTTWTRVNMAEGIPGVQTPLSWSFWDDSLDFMMREGYRRLGVIPAFEAPPAGRVDDRLVAIFFGRSALNVDRFREIADATPWTSREAFDEYYFGMSPADGAPSAKRRERYPIVFARTLPATLRLSRQVHRNYEATARWWAEQVAAASPSGLPGATARFRDAHARFLTIGSAHSAAAQIAGAICNFLGGLCGSAGRPELAMTLLGGHESVEVETTSDLWAVARAGMPVPDFLRRHGYQGPLMGELSDASWREDALPVERLARTYATMQEAMSPRLLERRRVAEREAGERELLSALGFSGRAVARAVFAGLQAFIPCREYGKAAMMMAFDAARAAARAIGKDLARQAVIEEPEDVFYLTIPELLERMPGDPREVIAQRRAQRAAYVELELPDTWTGEPRPGVPKAPGLPTGIGVSPGIVQGRARVIRDLREDADLEPGEILVCETTDPSWAAYFLVAGGVVTDLGGAMSHGAIVSREVGIPCVVNTKTGTSAIRSGDLLRIDGTTGGVERLEPGAAG